MALIVHCHDVASAFGHDLAATIAGRAAQISVPLMATTGTVNAKKDPSLPVMIKHACTTCHANQYKTPGSPLTTWTYHQRPFPVLRAHFSTNAHSSAPLSTDPPSL